MLGAGPSRRARTPGAVASSCAPRSSSSSAFEPLAGTRKRVGQRCVYARAHARAYTVRAALKPHSRRELMDAVQRVGARVVRSQHDRRKRETARCRMSRMKQAVTVNTGNAAVVGVVAIVALSLAAMLAVVAVFMVAMVVLGVVGVVALTVAGGMRYARYQADAQAALHLWRRQVQVDADRAGSEALSHAILGELAEPPKPRVALAMRRLTSSRPDAYTITTQAQREGAWRRR